MNLERRIDELYALPLSEFVAARNELAKKLRSGGDKEAAARVKALVKPSLSAWAVNQLHHHQSDELEELLAAGEELRGAQLAAAGERQRATAKRRRLLSRLLDRAEEHVRSGGGAAGRALRQRVGRSLEALSAYPADDPARPPLGRLTADVEPPGFEALGALRASLVRSPPAKRSAKRVKAAAKAKTTAARGRTRTSDDRKAARPAAVRTVQRRREERRVAELEERLAKVEREAAASREALAAAKAELEQAEAAAIEARERARLALAAATEARRRVAALRRDNQGDQTRLERATRELDGARAKLATLE